MYSNDSPLYIILIQSLALKIKLYNKFKDIFVEYIYLYLLLNINKNILHQICTTST